MNKLSVTKMNKLIFRLLRVALFFSLVYLLTKSNIFQEFIPCIYICTADYICIYIYIYIYIYI